MNFSSALASMCEECQVGLLAQVLRDIRVGMALSLRDFAEHINAQNAAYERQWSLQAHSLLRPVNKNIVHRWEGSETQAPSIPADFGKAQLQWIGTILDLDAPTQAQYDQAVLCYLLFDLDERARDICDERDSFTPQPEPSTTGVATMPTPFQNAGFTDTDMHLWEAATQYIQQPSPATEAAYLRARQQLEYAILSAATNNQQKQRQTSQTKETTTMSRSDEKPKNTARQSNRSTAFLLLAAAIFGIVAFGAGILFDDFTQNTPPSDIQPVVTATAGPPSDGASPTPVPTTTHTPTPTIMPPTALPATATFVPTQTP